ncbi:MAG: TAXI family TRAP transporter solute-binding subunit [Proteobacteria bacterium]|nr:TAXI family TRAP transporter solute-binding subunit [Pseudomonadota bacterium]
MLKFIIRTTICLLSLALLMISFSTAVSAQSSRAIAANKGRIGILTATTTGTYVKIGGDLARVLDGESGLRVVPYLSTGSVQNLFDLMNFRHADVALVNADSLTSFKVRNPDDPRVKKLSYIAKVYASELHLLVSRNSDIRSIADLDGRTVTIGQSGSGTWLTSQLVLGALGVNAKVVVMPNNEALQALKDGKVDANFFLTGKPSGLFKRISADEGLTLIGIPFNDALSGTYNETQFTSEDYPGLIDDKYIPTISVDVILATYGHYPPGSAEFKALSSFIHELNLHIIELQSPPNHPKWQQFSFSSTIPGWERSTAAVNVFTALTQQEKISEPSIQDIMKLGFE